ncbi:MAG: hypothetical protein K0R66_429 [Gammaproteobacteria bacterium]|jgi:hypothetical protein|nr:hypothetical protein [Gammaproteobacteria bacterium]
MQARPNSQIPEVRLTQRDLEQATNPVWHMEWGPDFVQRIPSGVKDKLLTDAPRGKVLLNGQLFADQFLNVYQEPFTSQNASKQSSRFISLVRQKLGLDKGLYIGDDPVTAYFQSLIQLTSNASFSVLMPIAEEMPGYIGVQLTANNNKNSFESEIDPQTGERQTVLKIKHSYNYLEFADSNTQISKVPFRASVEYDLVFVPNPDKGKPGAYQLRFPVIIRGEDAELCREIITQRQLSEQTKKILIDRCQQGLRHEDYFDSVLKAANPNFHKADESGERVAVDPLFRELKAGIIDSTKSPNLREALAQQRQFFVDLHLKLEEAVTEFYLYEKTRPLEQLKELRTRIRDIQEEYNNPSNPRFRALPADLRQKVMLIISGFEERLQKVQVKFDSQQLVENVKARYLGQESQALARDQKRDAVSNAICEAISKAPDKFHMEQIIRAYQAEIKNPVSQLTKLMRDPKHPEANNKIVRAAQQYIEKSNKEVSSLVRRNPRGYAMGKVTEQASSMKQLLYKAWNFISKGFEAVRPLFNSRQDKAPVLSAPIMPARQDLPQALPSPPVLIRQAASKRYKASERMPNMQLGATPIFHMSLASKSSEPNPKAAPGPSPADS